MKKNEEVKETMFQEQFRLLGLAMKAAKQEMLNEMGIDHMITKIQSYPAMIREQQGKLTALSQQLKEAKGGLVAAEGLIMAAISTETNEFNKPKFSNKEAREAELAQRKQSDWDYTAALQRFNVAEEAYNSAQFDLRLLEDEFRAHITAGQMLAAKVSALA